MGTDIDAGLKVADQALQWHRFSVVRRIILLTDGQGGYPLQTAESLKQRGVVIDAIGVGDQPSDVDEKLLRAVASVVQGERAIASSRTSRRWSIIALSSPRRRASEHDGARITCHACVAANQPGSMHGMIRPWCEWESIAIVDDSGNRLQHRARDQWHSISKHGHIASRTESDFMFHEAPAD